MNSVRQRGFTLVEILVAVMIGLIGVLIITQAYINSENFNRATLGEGGAQTNGLIALYTLERDARMSGYGIANTGALGCGNIFWYNDPNYSPNVPGWNTNPNALPSVALAPIVIQKDTVAPADVEPMTVTVMYSTASQTVMPTQITDFNPSSSEVEVDGTAGFADGDLILLVNATGCTMGKITQVQPGPSKLQLNPGVSAPYNPPAWGSFPTTYSGGDTMMNLGNPVVRTYSIFNGRLRVTEGLFQNPPGTNIDLVDGIVDLRAQYGHDTNADGAVDVWNSDTPTTPAGWEGVLAVRMGVLSRIGNYEKPTSGANCDATTAAPAWSGSAVSGGAFAKLDFATVTSEDRCYRYRVFETTVPLRNMIWRS